MIRMQQKLFDLPVLKICIECGEEKPANVKYFQKRSSAKDGLYNTCKECRAQYDKKKYEANLEKYKARSKKWQKANPEKDRANHKKWQKSNPEKYKARSKKWQKANPEKYKAYSKKWQKANLEKIKARAKKYYEANSEKLKAAGKKYRQANSEKIKAKYKKHREENPEKYKKCHLDYNKRRLAKFAYLFNLSKTDMKLARILWSAQVRQAKLCAICNLPAVHAHHLLYASKYPSLSLNLNNGIPLCIEHHVEVHLFDPYIHLIKSAQKPRLSFSTH